MKEQIEKRFNRNCSSYIAAYALVGMMVGLIFDVLVTYLMAVSPEIAKSITSYMGIASFAASAIAVATSKIGYKKIMISASIVISISLYVISFIQSKLILTAAVLTLLTGTTLFDVILTPFISAYTTIANRTSMFIKTGFANIFGAIIGTTFGGPMIVWIFSRKLNIGYESAKLLTRNIDGLNSLQHSFYISSNRSILIFFASASILILIPIFMLKEHIQDYKLHEKSESNSLTRLLLIMNKYVVLFLLYTFLTRFASSLIVPQVSIYLMKIGINRATVSLLGTLQFFAILLFMTFSNKISEKIGQVSSIVLLCLASVPFMLILANGYRFGNGVEAIAGSALFFRAGLVNAAMPIVNSLTMTLISKDYRAFYASLIFVMQSIAQITAGIFTKSYLFNRANGYSDAYYASALLFIAAHALLLTVFSKKYNKIVEERLNYEI